MITTRKQEHNGIEFTMYEAQKGNGEVTVNGKKFTLTGKPSLTKALNQYKFGDEVIIQVWAKKGTTIELDRVADNYDRIQVFFPKEVFVEMCKTFLEEL